MLRHRGRQHSTVAKIRVRISLTLPVEDVLYCNILQTVLESLSVYVAELLHPLLVFIYPFLLVSMCLQ